MSIEARLFLGTLAIGIGATLLMDLWNLFLKRAFSIPALDYCLLGRWLRHMPGGTFRHASISAAPERSFECTVGWIAHYTIGVVFTLVFVVLTSGDWLARPTLLPALLYVRSWMRFVRGLDELQRRIQMEAFLFAALGTVVVGVIVNALNSNGVTVVLLDRGLDLGGVFFSMFTLWLVGTGLANARYK